MGRARDGLLRDHDQLHRPDGDRHPRARPETTSSTSAKKPTATSPPHSRCRTRRDRSLSGRWLDWIGTRVGYAVALTAWSVASMIHAAAPRRRSASASRRALLGVTESPAYPAAVKTLAEWFPKKERALAMGFANAGRERRRGRGADHGRRGWPSTAGWRSAFIVTGAIGLIWLAFWIPLYRRPERTPAGQRGGTGAHQQRPAGADRHGPLGHAARAPAGVGRSRSASSSPTRSGRSTCSGSRRSCEISTAWT